jgi:hypothetical protein
VAERRSFSYKSGAFLVSRKKRNRKEQKFENRNPKLENRNSKITADERPETMKMAALAVVSARRRLGRGAMRRIAPTICQTAIFRAVCRRSNVEFRLETYQRQNPHEFRFSIFHCRFSTFEFRVSIFGS